MRAERTYRCRVRPCQKVKGAANHWFVAMIDRNGRFSADKFTSQMEFEKAASRHGAIEICSEACLHTHMSRWASGGITAAERPACASPAVLDEAKGELTCWVSDVYKSNTLPIPGKFYSRSPGELTTIPPREKSPARIVNYMDDGQKRSIWCFEREAFERVERTAGSYAVFKVKRRGEYVNVVDVLYVDGKSILHRGDAEARRAAK
jgi:hypothetical protein